MPKQLTQPLKVLIFGATGNAGRCLVGAALDYGHQTSVFVRDREKLRYVLGGYIPDELNVYVGDARDATAVAEATADHGAVVNAAAYVQDIRIFEAICGTIVTEADKHLHEPRRLWQFGGLPGLKVPHTNIMGTDLPGMPALFRIHKFNYELLQRSDLDWSFICPGPMYFAGARGRPEALRTTEDEMPYHIGRWTRRLPKIVHPFIMRSRLDELTVSYEDVSRFIMNNLSANGPYSKKRIGIAEESTRKPKNV